MSDLDSLKVERDGHLFWGKHRPRRELKPPSWIVERGEDGMPVRMWWTGYWNGERVWPPAAGPTEKEGSDD